jgi:hypothetical protein
MQKEELIYVSVLQVGHGMDGVFFSRNHHSTSALYSLGEWWA